ncbi:MAG TPA: ABC transporter ATP-binding protein [Candidatus Thermoplasmatota archaeon]|nr:ABC transporter ATP-binding protein [Candidatus Thermoplasmatota archaeon]
MAVPLVELQDVGRVYGAGESAVHALRGVTLRIEPGEFVAVVGPSGSGKSTLLHVVGLVDTATSGTLRFEGRDVTRIAERERAALRLRRLGFVFQQFFLLPILDARENVELPMREAGVPKAKRRARAEELLAKVGLAHRMTHEPGQLSGGEQQRVAIARALANDPALLIADEPTGELDTATGARIMDLFDEVNAAGTAVLMVTHDLDVAARARRRVHMRDGLVEKIVRRGVPQGGAAQTGRTTNTSRDTLPG